MLVTEDAGRRKVGDSMKAQDSCQGLPGEAGGGLTSLGEKGEKERRRKRTVGRKDMSGCPDTENQNLTYPPTPPITLCLGN